MAFNLFSERFDVGCTIEIQNTFESLHAHVDLDGDPEIRPGDRVKVHGEPVVVKYGDSMTLRRTATVERASLPVRLWTRLHGEFEIFEMFEVSFTSGRPV